MRSKPVKLEFCSFWQNIWDTCVITKEDSMTVTSARTAEGHSNLLVI